MKAYQCDVCGKLYSKKDVAVGVEITVDDVEGSTATVGGELKLVATGREEHIDLCYDCLTSGLSNGYITKPVPKAKKSKKKAAPVLDTCTDEG